MTRSIGDQISCLSCNLELIIHKAYYYFLDMVGYLCSCSKPFIHLMAHSLDRPVSFTQQLIEWPMYSTEY